jgi:hypothetical protein
MQPRTQARSEAARSLIEWIAITGLIALIIYLIVPVFFEFSQHRTATIAKAKIEMSGLNAAIKQYEAIYGRWPIVSGPTNCDISLGINPADLPGYESNSNTWLIASNSDLMIILLDLNEGVNAGHRMNPQQLACINAREVNDTTSPGYSKIDHQYRDPWGHPYVISLDANRDGRVRDVCYASPKVSENAGDLGLSKTNGSYELNGGVMIWSRGPDGQAALELPGNAGVNRDNVLGWR